MKPLVAQVSGGEPLLRRDIEDIIRAIRRPDKAPYVVLTTNGALLTREKYFRLREAGVDEISLSLDYPDERHDEFRGIPGLFRKIRDIVADLNQGDDRAITLSCVVQRDNFRDLINLAELARSWNLRMNFSTYTWLRTSNPDYLLEASEIEELRDVLGRVREHKRKYRVIYTSDFIFDKMVEFFEKRSLAGCRAGKRFVVVNPDGSLSPCGLIIKDFRSLKKIKKEFLATNTCEFCFTSIRANTEKPLKWLIMDSLQAIR